MWAKLEECFNEINLPYSRQGSYTEDEELPETFFTFWNTDSPVEGFYDNNSHRNVWFWYVFLYTTDPALIYSKLDEFIIIAKKHGFMADGNGKDIPSDVPNYLGRYIRLTYVENKIGG